jgi:hypothetical protein
MYYIEQCCQDTSQGLAAITADGAKFEVHTNAFVMFEYVNQFVGSTNS